MSFLGLLADPLLELLCDWMLSGRRLLRSQAETAAIFALVWSRDDLGFEQGEVLCISFAAPSDGFGSFIKQLLRFLRGACGWHGIHATALLLVQERQGSEYVLEVLLAVPP